MRLIALALIAVSSCWAAAGDSAPMIPSGYLTGHPRIGAPSNTFLSNLCTASAGACTSASFTRYQTAITNWDPNCITQGCGNNIQFRYLITGCWAKIVSAVSTSDCKSKIDGAVSQEGAFGPLRISDNTASATCSSYPCTLTDTAVNFTTGCNGGSCVNDALMIQGFQYTLSAVTATTVTISSGRFGVPAPNGTNLHIRMVDSPLPYALAALYEAFLYDWLYYSGGPTSPPAGESVAGMQTVLANLCYLGEQDYVNNQSSGSPLNDQFYEFVGIWGTGVAAMALYPDAATVGTVPKSAIYHLNFALDILFNQVLPFWKFVMLGDGTCTDASHCTDGGSTNEDWNQYDASNNIGFTQHWYTLPFIAWANASGAGVNNFFVIQNPWMKNYAYETMYFAQPDFTLPKFTLTNGYLSQSGNGGSALEYQACTTGNDFGSLLALGIIYNDGHIIDWARKGNAENGVSCTSTDGFEPSGWPWLTPDSTGNNGILHDRSDLPLARNFTGFGVIVARTGWGESDTVSTLKYKGCSWWSHCMFDAGQFTVFNRGGLATIPCPYHPGTASLYLTYFCQEAIAHNVIRVFDSGDAPTLFVQSFNALNATECHIPPNDGGQRRLGSGFQNLFNNSTCTTQTGKNYAQDSPINLAQWKYHSWDMDTGHLLAYATSSAYTYAAADLTGAYNIPRSRSSPDVNERTMRLAKWVRQWMLIPQKNAGTALVIVFDQVHNSGAAKPKAFVLHSTNQATIASNKFTIQRTENVHGILGGGGFQAFWPNGWFGPAGANLLTNINSSAPCSSGGTAPLGTNSCYQYNGQLTGWVLFPTSATLTSTGGATHFADDGSGGIGATGTNWDQALIGFGADAGGSWGIGDTGAGCTLDHICPNNATGPLDVGSWRLETYPTSQTNVSEQFGHVMYASTPSDSDIPTSVTGAVTGSSPTQVYTMTINMALGCVWTAVFKENGLASTISNNGNANCPVNLP